MDIKEENEKKKISYWLEKLHVQQKSDSLSTDKTTDKIAEDQGMKDAIQSISKHKNMDNRAMLDLVRKSNKILSTISTHKFLFDFYPSTINVEETRVTIIIRNFASSQVHSIDIKDISNIFINFAPFFAQLIIISSTFSNNNIIISNLRKKEAIYTRRIIEGLRIFQSKSIDTSDYTTKDLINHLEELSETEIVT